jgi:hypothetical protein
MVETGNKRLSADELKKIPKMSKAESEHTHEVFGHGIGEKPVNAECEKETSANNPYHIMGNGRFSYCIIFKQKIHTII